MIILGIESSCDETAAAIMENGNRLLANIVNSQIDIHIPFGGVVPELASRKHLEDIWPVVSVALDQADLSLSDIDALAVTQGPGLIGSLLVGLSFTKALAMVSQIPYVGVDHMVGHLLSVFLGHDKVEFPYIALVASGGHSSIFLAESPERFTLLGRTRDDAAGEAFDKVAKLLDLPYPGGPIIGKLAANGDPAAIKFPRSWLAPDSLDFSFSGLKTSVANFVHKAKGQLPVAHICASFQEAVVEILAAKAIKAAEMHQVNTIVIAGGVAANLRLRQLLGKLGHAKNLKIAMPPVEFCTDNAAMIALAGYHQLQNHPPADLDLDVYSRSTFNQPRPS